MKKNTTTPITLSAEQRSRLEQFTTKGVHSVRLVTRVRIVLALDTSCGRKAESPTDIATRLNVSRRSVYDAWHDFLNTEDVSSFPSRKQRTTPPVEIKVTGDVEAHVIALSCSDSPAGSARWSLRMLADKCVELQILNSVSHTTISRILKKTTLNHT